MKTQKLNTEEYGGYTIQFFKQGSMVYVKIPKIANYMIGHAPTKEKALIQAKNFIDKIKLENKSISCDPDDLDRSDSVAEYRKDGKILLIYQDEDPESPREWSNVGIMATASTRYNLGDWELPRERFAGVPFTEIKDYLVKEKDAIPSSIHPLFLYDHSGISISMKDFNDRWDSGMIGFIYTTKEKLKEMGLGSSFSPKVKKQFEGEVETYDQYLRGDIYGYKVFECQEGQWEETDSTWGFYGYDIKENGMEDSVGRGWKEV